MLRLNRASQRYAGQEAPHGTAKDKLHRMDRILECGGEIRIMIMILIIWLCVARRQVWMEEGAQVRE